MTIEQYDKAVIEEYPDIEWRKSVGIHINGKVYRGCRLCIGRLGIKASEPEGKAFNTEEEFKYHMSTVHAHLEVSNEMVRQ